jgi:hypothetical protein
VHKKEKTKQTEKSLILIHRIIITTKTGTRINLGLTEDISRIWTVQENKSEMKKQRAGPLCQADTVPLTASLTGLN